MVQSSAARYATLGMQAADSRAPGHGAQNEDSDLRRFLRGQGGDGYTSRGTGDEGLPSTPPPPLRGALGYGVRGYEMGGVGGGNPVAAASLRFGHALARHPLRARMAVGGAAYALTDLIAGALRRHVRLAAPGAGLAWSPEPAVQSCEQAVEVLGPLPLPAPYLPVPHSRLPLQVERVGREAPTA